MGWNLEIIVLIWNLEIIFLICQVLQLLPLEALHLLALYGKPWNDCGGLFWSPVLTLVEQQMVAGTKP